MKPSKAKRTIPSGITETEIQAKIIQRYRKEGYLVLRLRAIDPPGFPDLLVIRNKKATFIEVKKPGELPEPLQEFRHKQLKDQGFETLVLFD